MPTSTLPPSRLRGLCLAGPTASGKTGAALALAERLPVEVISVDSALVYRGMDIGTAKPTATERAAVPHHLIDILEPTEAYSAARFVADANALIDAITARGRLPLLVGGTMLYFKALFDGIDVLPVADPSIRAAIDAEARERGWPALHAELITLDPETAQRLSPNDAQRIQRALEVWRISGHTLTSFHSGRFAQHEAPPDFALISLEPSDRGWLHQRIEERFAQMIEAGLLDEVRGLRARGDLGVDLPSMRCVGYRQAWEALDANDTVDLHTLQSRGTAATRQLAKRQLTWLRGMPWRHTIEAAAPNATEQVCQLATRLWHPPH